MLRLGELPEVCQPHGVLLVGAGVVGLVHLLVWGGVVVLRELRWDLRKLGHGGFLSANMGT